MSKLHIIMPVKDSLDTTREAVERLYQSVCRDWDFTLYDDFSSEDNSRELDTMAATYGFEVVHWRDHTDHPSPNYLLTLRDAQEKAIADEADLIIIESDVLIAADTLDKMLAARKEGAGMIAAVTCDEMGAVNFPYLYAKDWKAETIDTKKRFSFCCTMLTLALLKAYPFAELDPEKNWYDVTISHRSIELGYRNLLLMEAPVLHKPHSSRPWKMLKYTNPLKYYWQKLVHGRDKI